MNRQLTTLVAVVLWAWVAYLIYGQWNRRNEQKRAQQVYAENVESVERFEKYGGGF